MTTPIPAADGLAGGIILVRYVQTADCGPMASRHSDWMAQAEKDLEHARRAAEGGSHEWACFAAHQASEKAIKALFQWSGAQVVRGHSLADMVSELARSLPEAAALLEAARELDRHYVPARYPDAYPSGAPFQYYSEKDSERAIAHAGEIDRFCHGHLP